MILYQQNNVLLPLKQATRPCSVLILISIPHSCSSILAQFSPLNPHYPAANMSAILGFAADGGNAANLRIHDFIVQKVHS
jgi:hypothetical protein